jgi:hypothetical protein
VELAIPQDLQCKPGVAVISEQETIIPTANILERRSQPEARFLFNLSYCLAGGADRSISINFTRRNNET